MSDPAQAAPRAPGAVLAALEDAGLLRTPREVGSAPGPWITVDGRRVLSLCSNDYLGLAGDPDVVAAAAEAVRTWGAGATASPLVCGRTGLHRALEDALAAHEGAEACVLFGSGFLANVGVLSALGVAGTTICSDARNHASIVDGCRLARADVAVYAHGDVGDLERRLAAVPAGTGLVVTDSVFSMDGDLAPLAEIVALAERHDARVIVDEAHATGVLGPGGAGLVGALGLGGHPRIVAVGTLGKSLGAYGAFACADAATVRLLVNRARSHVFSTALPPAALGAALAALGRLRADPDLPSRALARADRLRSALRARGLEVPDGSTPIVPLLVGDPRRAVAVAAAALADGVFAQAIRPPTVPDGTSRLRLVPTAAHAPEDLDRAADVLARAMAAA